MSPEEIKGTSVSDLVDKFGRLDERAKALEAEKDEIKGEFARRGLANAQRGKAFIVTISESTSTRLDTKAMREDPKLAKLLPKFEKTSTSTRVTVKAAPPQYVEEDE